MTPVCIELCDLQLGKQKHSTTDCAKSNSEAMGEGEMNLPQPFSKPLLCLIRETLMNAGFE